MADQLDASEIANALIDLPGWSGDPSALTRSYDFPTFLGGVEVVAAVAAAAEELDHHPDIDIRWRTVAFALSTHSAGGVTDLDIALAHRIRDLASNGGGL